MQSSKASLNFYRNYNSMRILSERGFPPALGTKPQSIHSTIMRANGTKLKFSEA